MSAYDPSTPSTVVYHSESNSWTTYLEYTELNFGRRQISCASTVYVPNYGVGVYGGLESFYNSSWTHNGQNMSLFEDETYSMRFIGYTNLTFLDINKPTNPWSIYQPQNNIPSMFTSYQTSIFDIKSNRIFFFGGQSLGKSINDTTDIPFDSLTVFDMKNSNWTTQPSLGGKAPSPRTEHTTTLVGPAQRDVLLYGGDNSKNNYQPCLDYAFTFNLDTFIWQPQNIISKPNTFLARTGHSAIPVNNDTVFIVFGLTSKTSITSTILILNTTTPSNITLVENYIDIKNASVSLSSPHKKPGTGAIAGTIIGSIGGALLVVGASVFWFMRKKKAGNEKKRQELEEHERQQRMVEPTMEVNWDEIEKKYVELPSPISYKQTYSPHLADDVTTCVDGNSEVHNTSPMLIQQGVQFQRPNAIDENDIPDTTIYKLQKPDGGA
ncbi:hypothetical protein INT47_011771 [Mucor saturninus]|uniref:Uncharacterized protein n=1 Tax=Mucor saturninus TaxID=64648 RepID=A0A8H7QK66_9FUNG|nr:hypothetical protein INT47_011771 [Mucor saturninus]